jgi:hypothetical protein
MAPSLDFSVSAFFRCDCVHVAHEAIHIGAIAVRAVDGDRLVIGDGLRKLERLLTVAAVELVDRHGMPPRTSLIYASDASLDNQLGIPGLFIPIGIPR